MSRAADLVDGALEATIAPSFTRIGPALRRRVDHWRPLDDYDLSGRVVVITGATSGLGLAAARRVARLGATVEIVARDAAKAEGVAAAIRADGGDAGFVVADMGDLVTVRRAAAALRERHATIHALVHNAGALDAVYATTVDGIERTAASQVVGPHLLTALLVPALRAGAPARVLWMASGGMYSQPLSVADLEPAPEAYDGTTAYARAKRAQVTLAELWAERLAGDGIVVHSLHPGWADTPGVARSLPTFRRIVGPLLRGADDGTDTMVWLLADDAPLGTTGQFWHDRRPRSTHRLASTRRADTELERRRLWDWVNERAGLDRTELDALRRPDVPTD